MTEDSEGRERGEELGFAHVDHERAARCGFPEVIYCPGKTPSQVAEIAGVILSRAPRVLMTRVDSVQAAAVQERFPRAIHNKTARTVVVEEEPLPRLGLVAVVTAGTADLPVAEEVRVTLETMGVEAVIHADVGVAGLHRVLGALDEIRKASVIVVVAGMEGALASVVGGLVDVPVIAVPTSVGYGAGFEGLAPLLTMLNSCAAGVSVVNIDNGFGAAYSAALISRAIHGTQKPAP